MWLLNFTTGVLPRNQLTNFIRITWANLGNNTQFFKYQIYNWSNDSPIILKADIVQVEPMEVKISDIKIATSIYEDSLDVEFYEIRLSIINKRNAIVNIFGISDTGIINEGNTVLYSQLVAIEYKDYKFNC